LKPLSINLENHGFKIHKWTGELVHTQRTPPADPEAPVFNGHRGELHTVVFNYAKDELGIPIHLGQRVSKYFEDENEAGIILDNGERVRPTLSCFGGSEDD
jgi:2-polyprenyl-6-methoxyphenol hydroxylase-like FAD-dependent oxidoreductase